MYACAHVATYVLHVIHVSRVTTDFPFHGRPPAAQVKATVLADGVAPRRCEALQERPEVQEAHRLAGDIDYILKVRVKNARAYDKFYQALISEVRVHNVTALLSMEEIKSTTHLPLEQIRVD